MVFLIYTDEKMILSKLSIFRQYYVQIRMQPNVDASEVELWSHCTKKAGRKVPLALSLLCYFSPNSLAFRHS